MLGMPVPPLIKCRLPGRGGYCFGVGLEESKPGITALFVFGAGGAVGAGAVGFEDGDLFGRAFAAVGLVHRILAIVVAAGLVAVEAGRGREVGHPAQFGFVPPAAVGLVAFGIEGVTHNE